MSKAKTTSQEVDKRVGGMLDIDTSGVNAAAASLKSLIEDFHKDGLVITRTVNGQAEEIFIRIAKS